MLIRTGLSGPLGRTRQLCAHCQRNTAGFWVGQGGVTRRPWCLSCCRDLDWAQYHVVPFGHGTHRAAHRPLRRGRRQLR